jgi:hypothetical protein
MNAQLKTHANCPACGGTLTVWNAMRSMSPVSMRCPHCRRKLAIRFRGRECFITVVVVALVIGIFALLKGWPHFAPVTLGLRLAIIGAGTFLLELATAVFYFSVATLVPRTDLNA